MSRNEERIKHDFIVSDRSPDGFWLIEVPVGIFEENRGNKWIDAVCFPRLTERYPDSYPENNDNINLIDTSPHPESVSRAELFRRLLELKDFSNATAVIYEFKTENQSLFKGIGQLSVYEYWFKREWGSRVKSKELVTVDKDYLIDHSTDDIDIQIKHYDVYQ